MITETGREFLVTWAVECLTANGHSLDDVYVGKEDRRLRMVIDGIPGAEEQTIQLAALYPDWPSRKSGHLEYLRSLQG